MGLKDWLRKKSAAKSASNILDDLRPLVAAVRTDINEAMGDAALVAAIGPDPPVSSPERIAAERALERWRARKARVVEAQKKLYQDVSLWSNLSPDRSFNEVILPALLSGQLVGSSESCFGPAIVAAFRVCEAVARSRGVSLEAHVSADVLETVKSAGNLYK